MALREVRRIAPHYDLVSPLDAPGEHTELQVWSCDYCQQVTLELYTVVREGNDFAPHIAVPPYRQTGMVQIWPPSRPRELPADVPEHVRDLYAEAGRAESAGAFRLAGAGYRATVEAICKDLNAAGNNLYARIEALIGQQSQAMVDGFHEARLLGNDSLHDGLAYSAAEVADVAELIGEAVLVLYVTPAQHARMTASRLARRSAQRALPPGP
jgi:hypothetical protein